MGEEYVPIGVYARYRDTPKDAEDEVVLSGFPGEGSAQRWYIEWVQDQIGAWLLYWDGRWPQAMRLPPIKGELRIPGREPDVHWPYQTATERWEGLSELERAKVHRHDTRGGRLVRASKGSSNDPWIRAQHHGTTARLLGPTLTAQAKPTGRGRGTGARHTA